MYGLSDRHFSLQNYSSMLSRTSLSYPSDTISELLLKVLLVRNSLSRIKPGPFYILSLPSGPLTITIPRRAAKIRKPKIQVHTFYNKENICLHANRIFMPWGGEHSSPFSSGLRRVFSSPPPPNGLPLFLTIKFKGLRFVFFVFCALTFTEPDYENTYIFE